MPVAVRWGLVAAAAAAVLWVRLLPLDLDGVADASLLRYRGEDGQERVYLGDFDSYLWLRHARNYLRTGTTCDAVVGGECRDTYALAPVGMRMRYARSLHIAAIVSLHQLIRAFHPEYPLPASAFWVPVLVGAVGSAPAFLLGERLAGPLGGFAAGLLVGTNAFFLQRSIGADDDVWNVVFPLFVVASAAASIAAGRPGRQVAYAVLAAAFVGLHAATWSGWTFTYVVVTIGLAANALVRVLRLAFVGPKRRSAQRRALIGGFLPLVVFYLTGALCAALAGSPEGLVVPLRAVTPILFNGAGTVPRAGHVPATAWPDVLSTVSELVPPNLRIISGSVGQPVYFFAGWLGLLVLWLPRNRWQLWHFGIMVGGNLLYYYLLTGPQVERSVLVAVLSLPVAIGVLVASIGKRPPADIGTALLLATWFVAALYLSYGGLRFILLLVAPAGIACGVAIGRLHLWLTWAATRFTGGRRTTCAVVLFVLGAVTVFPAVKHGVAAARAYLPQMDDAWWDTLTHIRDASPPDAIVNTWWDYGHWTKYVAERRVSADGASLSTHVPYWLARALLAANERETVGLLRMLDCGSDATPKPEGRLGAYGKLLARGLDGASAHAIVLALASLDRLAAGTLLAKRGLAPADVEDVLASTHCSPPPAYLVLSTRDAELRGIRYLADWDFQRPAVNTPALRLRASPRTAWRSCTPTPDASEWACPPAGRASPGAPGVFRYRPDAPEQSRFLASDGRTEGQSAPAVVVLAEAAGLREVSPTSATDEQLAVLVDVLEGRALIGPPELLRSTLVDLLYLDGRYAKHFEKFDQRVGYRGERVVTWRIHDEP
jgi:asparagine N-glycosylation enzyme membrane subunit Stt3